MRNILRTLILSPSKKEVIRAPTNLTNINNIALGCNLILPKFENIALGQFGDLSIFPN